MKKNKAIYLYNFFITNSKVHLINHYLIQEKLVESVLSIAGLSRFVYIYVSLARLGREKVLCHIP